MSHADRRRGLIGPPASYPFAQRVKGRGKRTRAPAGALSIGRKRDPGASRLRWQEVEADSLKTLGVDLDRFGELDYTRTQEIGSAVAFLDNDGLVVPSTQWDCGNRIMFESGASKTRLDVVVEPRLVDWQTRCKANHRRKPESDTPV